MKRTEQKTSFIKKYCIPTVIGSLLLLFFALTFFKLYKEQPTHTAEKIAQDVEQLAKIFQEIEKTCGILSFDNTNNPINFLTIKKDGFVGSEVGSMNLAHPEKWNGPYVTKNLHVQAKEYQVVQTYKGYFIAPGQGVMLPNGKRIGTDILLEANSDIPTMMKDPQLLMYEGKPLAAPVATEKVVVDANLMNALEDPE